MTDSEIQSIFTKNLRYLRREHGYSQQRLSVTLNVSRCSIGAYEEARTLPRLSIMLLMCDLFDVGLEALVTIDIEKLTEMRS